MAIREVYPPMILSFLGSRQREGAMTQDVIDFVGSQLDALRSDPNFARRDSSGKGWGIRDALTRLWQRGLIEKHYVYLARGPKTGPVRVYKYYLPEYAPRGVMLAERDPNEKRWYGQSPPKPPVV